MVAAASQLSDPEIVAVLGRGCRGRLVAQVPTMEAMHQEREIALWQWSEPAAWAGVRLVSHGHQHAGEAEITLTTFQTRTCCTPRRGTPRRAAGRWGRSPTAETGTRVALRCIGPDRSAPGADRYGARSETGRTVCQAQPIRDSKCSEANGISDGHIGLGTSGNVSKCQGGHLNTFDFRAFSNSDSRWAWCSDC